MTNYNISDEFMSVFMSNIKVDLLVSNVILHLMLSADSWILVSEMQPQHAHGSVY